MLVKNFDDLKIWKEARHLTREIYTLCLELRAVNDSIDLLAEPFIAAGVFFRLEVFQAPVLRMRVRTGQVELNGFVDHFTHSFPG